MEEFAQSLSLSDYLIITDIYAASEKPIPGMSAKDLCDRIKKQNRFPVIYLKKDNILPYLLDIAEKGDLVLTLGAGDINRVSDDLVVRLKEVCVKII